MVWFWKLESTYLEIRSVYWHRPSCTMLFTLTRMFLSLSGSLPTFSGYSSPLTTPHGVIRSLARNGPEVTNTWPLVAGYRHGIINQGRMWVNYKQTGTALDINKETDVAGKYITFYHLQNSLDILYVDSVKSFKVLLEIIHQRLIFYVAMVYS